ncbi:unnamed protein product [Rotaria sp. Silwood2]|nr:unnamed protein product [Rotaria sp. Silwood2]
MDTMLEYPIIYQSVCFACILFGTYILWKTWSKSKTQKNDKEEIAEIGDENIIKQGFRMNAVPENVDIIVIGSGIAGLTVASIMAQEGKKVLLLEQHDVIGGNTHTFKEKGFDFETGLHYIGGRIGKKTSNLRKHFDCITKNGVEWEKMDDVYDLVIIRDGENCEQYPMHSDVKILKKTLISSFFEEEKAIHEYFNMIKKARIGITILFLLKCIPYPWIQKIIHKLVQPFLLIFDETTEQVLSKLTNNKKLIGILTYLYGDYLEVPSRSSFGIQALVSDHYMGGGYFPIGGPSMIARTVVPIIEKSKGKAFVRAPVSSILINEENKAIGVVVKGHHIFSRIVVSAISSTITYKYLIPQTHQHLVQSHLKIIESPELASDTCYMSMFVGLQGDSDELNLPKRNLWIFPSWNHDENMKKFRNDYSEDFPGIFISFSSAKDPTYHTTYPKKSVASIITLGFYEHVEDYKDKRVKHRGDAYNQLKDQWKERMLEIFLKEFPDLKDKIVYVDNGTAITNDFYLGTYHGAACGLAHTPERFRQVEILSPTSPIKNLYLSGQDMLTCGVSAGLMSGFMTSYAIAPSLIFKYPKRN